MDVDQKPRYVPWADDAQLPGESLYALLNKLAWFAGQGPLKFVRDLKATETRPSPASPGTIGYGQLDAIWKSIGLLPHFPRIHGLLLADYIEVSRIYAGNEYSARRVSRLLRYCPDCISLGMHFDIGQLDFVEYCPHHQQRLISHCRECGGEMPNACYSIQDAFSCESCGSSLLRHDLNDIRSGLFHRREIARKHEILGKKIAALPHIQLYAGNNHTLVGFQKKGLQHALTRMFNSRPSGAPPPLTLASSHVAVMVERNERGQPCIRRLESSIFRPPEPDVDSNPFTERRLAHLRAGAWALQRFHDHIACICAAQELFRNQDARNLEFVSSAEPYSCPIGKGFAIWEANSQRSKGQQWEKRLKKHWGLDDRSIRRFAFYILEKGCLGSAILRFMENDRYALADWERDDFELDILDTKFHPQFEIEHVVLWPDINQVDTEDICNLNFRDKDAQLRWLEDVLLSAGIFESRTRASIHANVAVSSLLLSYGASIRANIAARHMHEDINRRVPLSFNLQGHRNHAKSTV